MSSEHMLETTAIYPLDDMLPQIMEAEQKLRKKYPYVYSLIIIHDCEPLIYAYCSSYEKATHIVGQMGSIPYYHAITVEDSSEFNFFELTNLDKKLPVPLRRRR
jgi:hypothetical protein